MLISLSPFRLLGATRAIEEVADRVDEAPRPCPAPRFATSELYKWETCKG